MRNLFLSKSKIQHQIFVILTSVVIWQTTSYISKSAYFPDARLISNDLALLVRDFNFWKSLFSTLGISLLGLFWGLVVAIFLSFFIFFNEKIEWATRGYLNMLRALPAIAILPILIASAGSSVFTTVLLTTFVVSLKIIFYIGKGVGNVQTSLTQEVRILKIPLISQVTKVYVPSALSLLGTGLLLSADLAFGTVVLSGVLAGTPGLGSALLQAESTGHIVRVFSYVFVMGIIGNLIYVFMSRVENLFAKRFVV